MSGKIITRVRERQQRANKLRLFDALSKPKASQLTHFDPATRMEKHYAIRKIKPSPNHAADPITRFFARLFRL